ncbi:MAG: T9SS type A sorting domain-containing protein [Chitinophagaceae bacterium]|nr:T9SS type A sorting domain-containing protein [Chitinophagaceae bacterium]
MKHFFTLVITMLSVTAFSQSVIITETFPSSIFNDSGLGGQSGSYSGNLSGWSLTSSANSIIEVDAAPGSGNTNALRFASGSGSSSNPRTDTATSSNLNPSAGACTISSLGFQFDWYVASGSGGNYEVKLDFSGDGGSTWNTVWSNTSLPSSGSWNTVTVSGGIPNSNSYWTGADFRFRFSARRNSGSSSRDIWFDNIRVLATSAGTDVPSFAGTPVLVQGTDLQPGAVYLYQNVLTYPQTLDALIKIEADSNAHATLLDNNSPNPSRFQPKVANDGTFGDGSETSDRGWVQFSITFIKDNTYQENDPGTDADDTYTSQTLSGLRYQHYDVDGFVNGSGSGAGYFREVGAISSPASILVNTPTDLSDGGTYSADGYSWRRMLGEIDEHPGISSDLDVTFTATFNAVSVVRFRLGFEYEKGNGGSTTVDREYATEFTCLSYPQQSTLPVKLLSFTGNYRNQATYLNWATENELNFAHFEVERSSSGTGFATIGQRASTSVNSSRQSYQYADDLSSIAGNVFYYRLKMVDNDGQFKYSNVIMVRKDSKAINGIAINPNPVVNGIATVRFTATAMGSVNFTVLDMNGRTVLQQQNRVYDGNNSISLNNLDRLQPGVYLLQMSNGEETTTVKFNVAR